MKFILDDLGEIASATINDIPAGSDIVISEPVGGQESLRMVRAGDGNAFAILQFYNLDDYEIFDSVVGERNRFLNEELQIIQGSPLTIKTPIRENMTVKDAVRYYWDLGVEISDRTRAKKWRQLSSTTTNRVLNLLPVYQRAIKKIIIEIENFRDESRHNQKKVVSINYRLKEIGSLTEKLFKTGVSEYELFEKIEDIAGVRIVCEYIGDVYELVEWLVNHPQFNLHSSIDDKISKPSTEGYRGVHLTVRTSVFYQGATFNDILVEIQIRTAYQNSWAMKTHDLTYKRAYSLPANLLKQMKILSDTLYNADQTAEILKEEIERYQEDEVDEGERGWTLF